MSLEPLSASDYRRAFTIVELLIVVVVIAILSALTLASYSGLRDSANSALIQSEADSIYKQLAIYNVRNGQYPSTIPDSISSNESVSIQYSYGPQLNSYCLTMSSASEDFHITNSDRVITQGTCSGHESTGEGEGGSALGVPGGFVVSGTGDVSISLSWDSVSEASSYAVECDSDSAYTDSPVSTTTVETSTDMTNLTPGDVYCRVRSENEQGVSAYSSSVVSRVTIKDSLIAWWKLNGSLADDSGSGNNGISADGDASPGIGQNGQPSSGYNFDGNNDRITLPKYLLAGAASFTFSGWVYFSSGHGDQDILVIGGHTSNSHFLLWRDEYSMDRYGLILWSSGGAIYTDTPAQDGSWIHLTVTFVAGTGVRIYINGTEDGNSPIDLSASVTHVPNSVDYYYLGNDSGGSKELDGALDDVRLYERALSSSEIYDLYAAGAD